MKTFFAVLAALGVGFAAAFVVVSNQKESAFQAERAKLEQKWANERERLQAELAAEKARPATIERVKEEVAVAIRRSPKEILDHLLQLKPAGAARIQTIRKIVHELEELAQLQAQALPAIREFLARNTDLEYPIERSASENNADRRWTPPWQRNSPPTEFTLPPSLRIGLFDVLKEIGGADAQAILAEVLGNSGRAVEVAYIARLLEEMAPGKYRETALVAAKDLLRNPLSIDNPNRLDDQAEGYLYGVLEMYGDVSFAEESRQLLVDSEGRINRNVRDYLTKTQGEGAIPVLYEVYKNGALSNTWDKASVASKILDYVGQNAQANNFLNELVADTSIDARMRSFAVLRLAGGFGDAESPKDPAKINQLIPIVQKFQKDFPEGDPINRAAGMTERNLNNLLEGKPVEVPWGGRGRGREGGTPQPGAP